MNRFLLLLPLFLNACGPVSNEPGNLSELKREVTAYADNGSYSEDLSSSVSSAKAYLAKRRAKGGEKLTVIFDIDETVLSNLPHMRQADWGYQSEDWNAWVAKANAPAIRPLRDIYRAALENSFRVIFLTGRTESQRIATVRNLRKAGMGEFSQLILRPDTGSGKSEQAVGFKTGIRRKLTSEGHTIVASFGDQASDLEGGYAERTFKLPNPFYSVP